MHQAKWNGVVVAEATETLVVERNHYFPPAALKMEYFRKSANNTITTCAWKGECQYYDIIVNGKVNADAAWYYPNPKPAAKHIAGYVAFWKGVDVA